MENIVPSLRFPLIDPQELPEPGTSREGLCLDLKATVDPKDGFELAKDVAAFANSVGGTILVGAHEGASNTLGRYAPMTEDLAGTLRDAYNKAVGARCEPAPIIDPILIPRDGGWLVAVNVWPFPSQAVGVSTRDPKHGGVGDNGWAFPLRTGIHTAFLKPGQLPMLMIPEVRRVAALLEQIPPEARKNVQVFWRSPRQVGSTLEGPFLSLVEVRSMENVAIFANQNPRPVADLTKGLHVPLDAIENVWSVGEFEWCIAVTGRLEEISDGRRAWHPA